MSFRDKYSDIYEIKLEYLRSQNQKFDEPKLEYLVKYL